MKNIINNEIELTTFYHPFNFRHWLGSIFLYILKITLLLTNGTIMIRSEVTFVVKIKICS